MQGRVLSNELSKEKYRNIVPPLAHSDVTVVAVSKLRTPAEIRGFRFWGTSILQKLPE